MEEEGRVAVIPGMGCCVGKETKALVSKIYSRKYMWLKVVMA